MDARAPKGTADMLPPTARAWEHLTRTAQELFARYGYEPIYTPLFEHTEVFTRGIGEATDIVSKEMYTFVDKGNPPRSLTLRPEGTASVVRSALEHNLVPSGGPVVKLYYTGPMFRYERPQKGRMRQFWQIGAEMLGARRADRRRRAHHAAVALLRGRRHPGVQHAAAHQHDGRRELPPRLSREDLRLHPRPRRRPVRRVQPPSRHQPAARLRLQEPGVPERSWPARRCCATSCATTAPSTTRRSRAYLDALGIPYIEDPSLVRGLDYYTRTVFEVQVDAGLGSQNAIGGGGRYDRLMQEYDGPATPGLGFALGFERTLLAMEAVGATVRGAPEVRGLRRACRRQRRRGGVRAGLGAA